MPVAANGRFPVKDENGSQNGEPDHPLSQQFQNDGVNRQGHARTSGKKNKTNCRFAVGEIIFGDPLGSRYQHILPLMEGAQRARLPVLKPDVATGQ